MGAHGRRIPAGQASEAVVEGEGAHGIDAGCAGELTRRSRMTSPRARGWRQNQRLKRPSVREGTLSGWCVMQCPVPSDDHTRSWTSRVVRMKGFQHGEHVVNSRVE